MCQSTFEIDIGVSTGLTLRLVLVKKWKLISYNLVKWNCPNKVKYENNEDRPTFPGIIESEQTFCSYCTIRSR